MKLLKYSESQTHVEKVQLTEAKGVPINKKGETVEEYVKKWKTITPGKIITRQSRKFRKLAERLIDFEKDAGDDLSGIAARILEQ